jgi:Leucine-rich repeat (LRR) protein
MLEWTLVKSLRDLPSAGGRKLWFSEVPDLEDLAPILAHRTDLVGLRIQLCKSFRSLEGIGRFTSLTTLDVSHCPALESLAPLADLKELRQLGLFGHEKLTTLTGIRALRDPVKLAIPFCTGLTDISELAALRSLRELVIESCTALTDLRVIGTLSELVSLSLKGCRAIATLNGFGAHVSLESLDLSGCTSLRDLRGLGSLPSLRRLQLNGATSLTTLDGIEAPRVESLGAGSCSALNDVSAIASMPALREIELGGCSSLERADAVASLERLERLELWGTRVESLPPLRRSLRELSLFHTPLRSIACAFPCDALEVLRFDDTRARDRAEIARVLEHPKLRVVGVPSDAIPGQNALLATGLINAQQLPKLRQLFEPGLAERSKRWVGLSGPPRELELFRSVVQNPRDHLARRAYAAELRRAREPRGEFIALDEPTMDDVFAQRPERASQLYDAHSVEWFYGVRELVEQWSVGGGFVQAVTMSVGTAAENGLELVRRTPLRTLRLEGVRAPADRDGLFASAWTEHLESLAWQYPNADDLSALASSKHLRNVSRLELREAEISAEAAAAVASAAFPALRDLVLVRARPRDGAFAMLMTLPLASLDLSGSYAIDEALRALAASPSMSSLRTLRLAGCSVSNESLEALAASPHLGALEEIDLGGAGDSVFYPAPIFRSTQLRSLRLVVTDAYWSTEPSGDSTIETPHGPVTYRFRPGYQYY